MCGFGGLIFKNKNSILHENIIRTINDKQSHRGPDYNGFLDYENVKLCHQRLSILDLSSNANQPMVCTDNKFIICFNGEIYNHIQLRRLISKKFDINWKSNSDTETLLNTIKYFGITKALEMIEGMFSFCFLDKEKKVIHLVRDRFGEKPLFYLINKEIIVFSSELKSLKGFSFVDYKINDEAVEQFKQFGYISSPNTIYANIKRLKPGQVLTFNIETHQIVKDAMYWSPFENLNTFQNNKLKDLSDLFEYKLEKSVKERMISDVPLGCFLSGGIDSTLIAYFMQKNSVNKIDTFTIGFSDQKYNEAPYAKKIANYFGTNHNELYVDSNLYSKEVSRLHEIYDEPFCDPSQLPMLTLSNFVSSKVKVALSGDGGDEIFSGYNRHQLVPYIWQLLRFIPQSFRFKIAEMIKNINHDSYNLPLDYSYRFYRIADLLKARNFNHLYDISRGYPNSVKEGFNYKKVNLDYNSTIRLLDLNDFLVNDVLNKVDIASMRSSLEVRAPFLNRDIFDTAFSINKNKHQNIFGGKIILKSILKKYLPRRLYDRPKSGFSVPIGAWLKADLKPWAEDIINSKIQSEYYDSRYIKNIWKLHKDNKFDFKFELWNYLIFNNWFINQSSEK
jgi:asparagine synthase (glutamine-hydrolysing)